VAKTRGEQTGSNSTSNTIKHKAHNSESGPPGQPTGNTVININIDNRGGQTSSYSHLIPGQIGQLNLNMPDSTVAPSSGENKQRRD
jgi:hypothetical protein